MLFPVRSLLPPREYEHLKRGLSRLGLRSLREFYSSACWITKRQAYFSRHEYHCGACPARRGLQLHHRTYERLGNERDADLSWLCDECHGAEHRRWTRRAVREGAARKKKRGRSVLG